MIYSLVRLYWEESAHMVWLRSKYAMCNLCNFEYQKFFLSEKRVFSPSPTVEAVSSTY